MLRQKLKQEKEEHEQEDDDWISFAFLFCHKLL